jgi:hypothetical protein
MGRGCWRFVSKSRRIGLPFHGDVRSRWTPPERQDRVLESGPVAGERRHGSSGFSLGARLCGALQTPRNHARLEPIALLRDRLDVLAIVGGISQRLAKRKDVVGEVRLLDEGIRPDPL